jgi:hypothetical protein
LAYSKDAPLSVNVCLEIIAFQEYKITRLCIFTNCPITQAHCRVLLDVFCDRWFRCIILLILSCIVSIKETRLLGAPEFAFRIDQSDQSALLVEEAQASISGHPSIPPSRPDLGVLAALRLGRSVSQLTRDSLPHQIAASLRTPYLTVPFDECHRVSFVRERKVALF